MPAHRILLIHTGGTIGMVRSGDGFTPGKGLVEAEIGRLTKADTTFSVEIAALEPLIDSANATPADWNRIAETVERQYRDFDGFVVTHGTDTLAYTAAALSLAFLNLEKPVILTGSMLPLGEPETDGARNLADALRAARSADPGVWVQFAGQLMHGARIRKTHSHAFDAFDAVPTDAPPLRHSVRGFGRDTFQCADIAMLPVVPGGAGNLLLHAAQVCDGLILRCFGSGTLPNTPKTEEALRTAEERAIPVLALSQCPEGRIALGTYAAGAMLKKYNAVDGRDMTMEVGYAKMMLAVSLGGNISDKRAFLRTALCGEISGHTG